MDPGSLPPLALPHPAPPDLPALRAQLSLALESYPELRRGLRQALVEIDRCLGQAAEPAPRDRRRVEGLA